MTKDKRDILRALNDAIESSQNMEKEAEEGWAHGMQVYDTSTMTSKLKEIKRMVHRID